jgi:outer membrane murein-binding lipoprotein Lpp
MKENIKIILAFILGILISGACVYAGAILSSDKVSYNKTTVKASLDNLFSDVENGKKQIAQAITNKGVNTLSTDSWDTIASNINNISIGILDADKTLYQALEYSGLVTENMTFEEMCKALKQTYPQYIEHIKTTSTGGSNAAVSYTLLEKNSAISSQSIAYTSVLGTEIEKKYFYFDYSKNVSGSWSVRAKVDLYYSSSDTFKSKGILKAGKLISWSYTSSVEYYFKEKID